MPNRAKRKRRIRKTLKENARQARQQAEKVAKRLLGIGFTSEDAMREAQRLGLNPESGWNNGKA